MTDIELMLDFARKLQGTAHVNTSGARRRQKRKKIDMTGFRDTADYKECLPLGVDPKHVKAARDLTKRFGLTGIKFDNDGTCLVSDQKQKLEYARLTGNVDFTKS